MKNIILSGLLLCSSYANSQPEVIDNNRLIIEQCNSFKQMAKKIMEARQAEIPIEELIEVTVSQNNVIARRFIFIAYERPLSSNEENKKKAIIEFGDQVHLGCLKNQLND